MEFYLSYFLKDLFFLRISKIIMNFICLKRIVNKSNKSDKFFNAS